MKHIRSTLAWLGLAATTLLAQGCTQALTWNGIYSIDLAGGAKTCVVSPVAPQDGTSVLVQMQMSNEGGWCGIVSNHSGVGYDSYLLVARPSHGKVFAHHVGSNTRIDYTPDTGFTGTDSFAVRLIPGDAVIQGAVTVSR
jgi:hypothetical protein